MLKIHTLHLTFLLLDTCIINGRQPHNLDACGGLSLDAFGWTNINYLPFHFPSVPEAFHTVALLPQGWALNSVDIRIEDIAVLSAWGWSICVSSFTAIDPK